MHSWLKIPCVAGGLALLATVMTGCGGGSAGSVAAPAAPITKVAHKYVGTQSPGDVWHWNLGDGTFTATNDTLSHNYSGTSTLLDSGFYKLTITASNDAGVAIGSVEYAFEVPGVALIAAPAGLNTAPVVASSVGANPTGTNTYNWISIPRPGWTVGTDEAYGTAQIALNGAAGTITINPSMLDGTALTSKSQPISFVDGQFDPGGGTGCITPAGVIMVDNGPRDGGVVGVKAAVNNVDTAELISHEYRGLLFTHGGRSQLMWMRANGSGGLRGGAYLNPETPMAADGEEHNPIHIGSLGFTAQPSPGLLRGTLNIPNSGSSNFVFVVNVVGGKHMLFGFAGDGPSPDNFLMIEK